MAILHTIDQVNTVTAQTITTTSETIVATAPLINTSKPNGFVWLHGHVNLTLGTGAASLILRVRRGTTVAGTVLGNPVACVVSASTTVRFAIDEIDTYVDSSGIQWVLTAVVGSATANSTVNEAALLVLTF